MPFLGHAISQSPSGTQCKIKKKKKNPHPNVKTIKMFLYYLDFSVLLL